MKRREESRRDQAKKRDEEEREKERLEEEKERQRIEEEKKKEDEEYQKLKAMFTVEESGNIEDETSQEVWRFIASTSTACGGIWSF
jgi:hypothetical protein